MQQHINAAGLALVQRHEALRLRAYQDTGGVWTIGWGHTAGVQPGQVITLVQAEDYLKQDLAQAEACCNQLGERVPLNTNQFSALVSFVFNVGCSAFDSSTLHNLLCLREYGAAAAQFQRWVYDRRRVVLAELVSRRADERTLFQQPVGPA